MEGHLPENIQALAAKVFEILKLDPMDPRLGNEELYDTKKGRHRSGSRSVRITLRYRAIYVVDKGADGRGEEQACWYWIGSREEYANFTYCRQTPLSVFLNPEASPR
jgi:hypothetical protein